MQTQLVMPIKHTRARRCCRLGRLLLGCGLDSLFGYAARKRVLVGKCIQLVDSSSPKGIAELGIGLRYLCFYIRLGHA